MPEDPERDDDLALLRARIHRLGLSDYDVWLDYLQCGGTCSYLEFEAYLFGALSMLAYDRTALRQAVWEAENF